MKKLASFFLSLALGAGGLFPIPEAKVGRVRRLVGTVAPSEACSEKALKKARLEGVSITALRQKGCSLDALKAAGFTAAELKKGSPEIWFSTYT